MLQDHAGDARALCTDGPAHAPSFSPVFVAVLPGFSASKSWIPRRGLTAHCHAHSVPQAVAPLLFAFNQPSSRLALPRWVCLRRITFCWKEIMGFRNSRRRARPWVLGLVLVPLFALRAGAQGPAPETGASTVPWRGTDLLQLHFHHTRPDHQPVGDIPLTARPTFSHEGDFNFTWGFHRDLDLTVLVPVVPVIFEMPSANGNPLSGGTGLGDAMVLVKYRFYRRIPSEARRKHP